MKYTAEMIGFLKSFKGEKTLKELATLLKEKYGIETISINYFSKCLRKVNVDYKYEKCNAGCFKRGFSAWNKGIKTGVKTWEYKQRVIWKEIYGEIPNKHIIIFADGDKSNFDVDNLICVSRNELRQLNLHKLKKDDAELTKTGLNIAKIMIKLAELRKEKK